MPRDDSFSEPAPTTVDLDPLTGELVRLRALRDDDLSILTRWWSDQSVAVYQETGPTTPRPAEAVTEMFRNWSKNEGANVGLSVISRDDEQLIGHAALWAATVKDRCAELGIVIGPEHQGRGLGTDAVRLLVRYGFAELGLHRIELGVHSYNPRAIASYRKVGFVEEGRQREAVFRSGQWHDSILMGLLHSDWTPNARGHPPPA